MLTEDVKTKFNNFFIICDELATFIETDKEKLISLLTHYETHQAAEDEILRTLEALRGVKKEFSPITNPLQDLNIATIFPLNLPLYSLIIFGVIPSVFSSKIFIRPPEVMHTLLQQLWEELSMTQRFPNVTLNAVPRQVFVQLYARDCDVIIFTGKYSNAMAIHEQCPHALLVYNGSGVNPFVLFENADVKLAARKAVEMRCFNSGQDCAGPDAFFVPSSLADTFIDELESLLKDVKVGDTTDPAVTVGPTMKQAYITELKTWFDKERSHMVYGGAIDEKQHLVHPTIMRKAITELDDYAFHEFFAPYFYVITYDSIEELQKVLQAQAFKDKGMYISVFGNNEAVESTLTYVKVLKNVIVNDVEQGNQEYGGYGAVANFLLYGDKKVVHPLLISRDIHEMLTTADQQLSQ